MRHWLPPVLVAFLLVIVAAPVLLVLAGGLTTPAFEPTLFYLKEALAHPVYRAGLWHAAGIATATTALCLALTLPLAWFGWRFRFRGQGVAEALLLGPLILPPFVGALGVFQIAGHAGVLNTLGVNLGWWTWATAPDWMGEHRLALIVLVQAIGLYPVLYLTLTASLARLDPALLEAAAAAGAGPWTILRRITLPLLMPGIFAGASVIFVWAFTDLGTPLMLGFDQVTPVQIFNGLQDLSSNRVPLALAVVLLVVVGVIYGGTRALVGRGPESLVVKGGGLADQTRPLPALLGWLPYLALTALAVTPHLAVILLAMAADWYQTLLPRGLTAEHYQAALAHPQVVPAILNSLGYATAATLLAVILGLGIAWATVRWKTRWTPALETLAMIPLAVPGLLMAFGFLALGLLAMTIAPGLRPLVDPQQNPTLLLVIAYAVRRLPQVVRAVTAGLQQAPAALEEAAASCGAGPLTRLRRITVPLIAGSLAAAALLTFSFAMLEVSDSLILAQQRDHWPITKVIYDLVTVLGSGPAIACAFAVWAMAFLAGCLAAAGVILGKSPASLFRQ